MIGLGSVQPAAKHELFVTRRPVVTLFGLGHGPLNGIEPGGEKKMRLRMMLAGVAAAGLFAFPAMAEDGQYTPQMTRIVTEATAGTSLAGLIALTAVQQTPPIFQPGAPGTASRVITPAEAIALGRSTFTDDDVAFVQHMIVHHAQAVEMVELLQTRGVHPTVRRLGQRIALGQEAEIALMRGWLSDRSQPLEMPGMGGGHAGMDHSHHAGHAMPASDTPIMAGMLSPAQMQALAAASGPAFDRLFLEGMIRHHQGALDMVDALLANPGAAEDTMLSDFTTSVVADQSAEILRMQSLLSEL